MAIETVCDGCGVQLRVADEFAGRQARCPQCGSLYTVPTAKQAVPASLPPAQPIEGSTPADDEAARGTWYVQTPEGQTYGPVSKEVLDQWTHEGRLNAQCKIRESDSAMWRSAGDEYPQLTDQAPQTSGANPFRDNPYSQPHGAGTARSFQQPHRGILVLVFGILGFVICPVFGIASWVMGNGDLKKMNAGTMDPEGRVMTQVGMVLGIVQSVILMLFGAWIMFMIFIAVMSSM